MISLGTKLLVADNSGAKQVKCIKILGGSTKKKASINDLCVVSVKKTNFKSKMKVETGQVHYGLVLETKKGIKRKDGTHLKCFRNTITLWTSKNIPLATRISTIATYELKKKWGAKIFSLCNGNI